jgi:hypothetical protein
MAPGFRRGRLRQGARTLRSEAYFVYAATSLPRRKPGKGEAQRSIRAFYEAVFIARSMIF